MGLGRARLLMAAAAAVLLVGCGDDTSTAELDDRLDDPLPTALVAAFSSEPDYEVTGPTSCPLRSIAFTDESEGDPETWAWEFSDGSTSAEQDPIISTRVGEATLTVTRGDESDSVTEQVELVDC